MLLLEVLKVCELYFYILERKHISVIPNNSGQTSQSKDYSRIDFIIFILTEADKYTSS